MMAALGVLGFVIALLLSVMIHEAGHFISARFFGMKVTEFFLGFGKRLWSFRKGETEYGIKAIPAGGYCRIVGMSAREELPEADRDRAFYRHSVPQRLVVLGAGSFLHFILGFLLLLSIFAGVGVLRSIPTISSIASCVPTTTSQTKCGPSDLISPAKAAGLRAGDRIISINGQKMVDWVDGITLIQRSPGKSLDFLIAREGRSLDLTITPAKRVINGKASGYVGIQNDIALMPLAFGPSLTNASDVFRSIISSSVSSLWSLPSKIPTLLHQTFGGGKRDSSSLVGVIGVAEASAQNATSGSTTPGEKLDNFLLMIASLNIFVGIFNLLPLLPLDGGHMAIAAIDGARNILARLRRRPSPRPIELERLMPLTVVVFIFLAGLSALLLFADIFNPVNFNL